MSKKELIKKVEKLEFIKTFWILKNNLIYY